MGLGKRANQVRAEADALPHKCTAQRVLCIGDMQSSLDDVHVSELDWGSAGQHHRLWAGKEVS